MHTSLALIQHGAQLVADGNDVPNPGAKAPKGVEAKASDIMAYIKWGSFFLIVAGGFAGVGALVGGKVLGHHKSASVGIGILFVAVIAGVIWAAWYAFITA